MLSADFAARKGSHAASPCSALARDPRGDAQHARCTSGSLTRIPAASHQLGVLLQGLLQRADHLRNHLLLLLGVLAQQQLHHRALLLRDRALPLGPSTVRAGRGLGGLAPLHGILLEHGIWFLIRLYMLSHSKQWLFEAQT